VNAVAPIVSNDVAVLASGGLDSAILVAEVLRQGRMAHPIYVRFGLAWEPVEEAHLRRFLDTLASPTLVRSSC
jgi:7-cyano-7-deazaguanine synthase in queuosine biosynthesis